MAVHNLNIHGNQSRIVSRPAIIPLRAKPSSPWVHILLQASAGSEGAGLRAPRFRKQAPLLTPVAPPDCRPHPQPYHVDSSV